MLAPHLRQLREKAGLSPQDAAALIGVGRTTLHSWETDGTWYRRPSPSALQSALDAYRASPEEAAEAWRLLAATPAAQDRTHGEAA